MDPLSVVGTEVSEGGHPRPRAQDVRTVGDPAIRLKVGPAARICKRLVALRRRSTVVASCKTYALLYVCSTWSPVPFSQQNRFRAGSDLDVRTY